MLYPEISIVIPTFNGRELLKNYLPSVVQACRSYSFDKTEIIVVDDASKDGTVDYLKIHFPFIKIICQKINKGFSSSANLGIYSAQNKIVVLLNNDVSVSEDFLHYLPIHFKEGNVFAVRLGLKSTLEDRIGLRFRYGFLEPVELKIKDRQYASFVGGGACAFDKEKFIQLGGFDELFSPFYYEDVDLSYRAWKRGWVIIYEPKSVVIHLCGATISRFYCQFYTNAIAERNRYFLFWKNINDRKLFLKHLFFIPLRQMVSFIRLDFSVPFGFFLALKKLGTIIKKRRKEQSYRKLKDREILRIFKDE